MRRFPSYFCGIALLLLAHGCGMSPEEMKKGIHAGAAAGNVELVSKILKRNKEYATDNDGENDKTPLHVAANAAVARLLIEAGADVNATDASLATPLHTARNAEVVDVLVEKGGDIGAKNVKLETPVQTLTNPAAIDALVRHGAKLYVDEDAVRKAVSRGSYALVDVLLKNGGSANLRYGSARSGDTLLHRAAGQGDAEMVKVLIKHGADVDARGRFRATPLHQAALKGKVAAAKVLLDAGADANARLSEGAGVFTFHHRVGPMPTGSDTRAVAEGTPMKVTTDARMRSLLKRYGGQ